MAASPSISNEYKVPFFWLDFELLMALSMLSPRTNCFPINFIARDIATRITGSPNRLTAALNKSTKLDDFFSFKIFPESIKANEEAFSANELDFQRCLSQSDGATLSLMRSSTVALSGIRSNASAKHIRASPSSFDKPYSLNRISINPIFPSALK